MHSWDRLLPSPALQMLQAEFLPIGLNRLGFGLRISGLITLALASTGLAAQKDKSDVNGLKNLRRSLLLIAKSHRHQTKSNLHFYTAEVPVMFLALAPA